MFYRCRNCGGNVVYSPEKRSMYCPFCDSLKSEERAESPYQEMALCPNCGGEVTIHEHTAATQCPYCDSYLILNERVEGQYAPKMLVPFEMGKETCKKSIREKFKKNLFAPTDFLSEVRLNGMRGSYVPYWFYHYDTHCSFQGEGTKVRVWRSGNTEYTETSFYAVRREMDINFEKIPVDASEAMPDDVMDLMEPYDYGKMVEFTPEYMSGFWSEKYNMPAETVEFRAKKKMDEEAAALLKESYAGYRSVRAIGQNITVRESNHFYGLLPVWKYTYVYGGKNYPFYVNGQTGKIVGEAPVSKKKVWAYTATLWGCMTAFFFLLPLIASQLF